MAFDDVFERLPDNAVKPRRKIRVGGIIISPGMIFRRGASFGGVDFTQFLGNELEVEPKEGALMITKIYGQSQPA